MPPTTVYIYNHIQIIHICIYITREFTYILTYRHIHIHKRIQITYNNQRDTFTESQTHTLTMIERRMLSL